MNLQKSDPTTYDNNPTLMRNLLRNRQRAFCDKVESRGIVLQLLSHFLKYAQPKNEMEDNRIAKAVRYIHKHIAEEIELEKLAELSCLSKDHFIRLFKKEWVLLRYNMSIKKDRKSSVAFTYRRTRCKRNCISTGI